MFDELSRHPVAVLLSGSAIIITLIGFGYTLGQSSDESVGSGEAETIVEQSISESSNTSVVQEEVTTTPPATEAKSTEAEDDEPVFIKDLQPVVIDNAEWREGSIGLAFEGEALFSKPGSSSVEYRVDRKYQTFSAMVGFDDESESDSRYAFWIEDESGKILFPVTSFELGDVKEVEVDVSDSIRFIIHTGFEEDDGGTPYGGQGSIGVANGLLTPS